MQKKEVTIYDIAQALQVSPATVSRGLKNHPSISKKTCKKIQETAQKMGYRSNALASSLRTSRSFTLGVIVPRLDSNFMSTVLAGMEKSAVELGYHLIIMQSFETDEKEKECARLLFNHRVDGLLVSTSAERGHTEHFAPFLTKNIPVLFFDRVPLDPHPFSSVTINNQRAGYELTKIMLEKGARQLLHVTGNTNLRVYKERLDGFRSALKEFSISILPDHIWQTNLGVEDGIRAAEKILRMKTLPDGIFVANDTCAIAIINHLQKHDIEIPDQIQISGFNNDPFASLFTPQLTTVQYPGTAMGERAVTTIVDLIKNKNKSPKREELDFTLIPGSSTL
ncbi:LacI family DNA-binding transcriptional regulator [Marinilabilia salmonicolor]|jgi:LacI family transcriptional regulator|uniref:LacI family transcriptional regulator n=1 Tax=Marinilabilia salmonicolor TaxID=989 RepID=A0A2T0XT44_9BACT|nr:LacI family DNA-binding transcriptional regulator [Marinilabilia salmonicolor]PRZ02119.1 LacI family transcriptional regulator [Marinilabilia salmonicolor]RCW36074.1 LacI family transcriptional regulator [Marinilabilia salmonicolor]